MWRLIYWPLSGKQARRLRRKGEEESSQREAGEEGGGERGARGDGRLWGDALMRIDKKWCRGLYYQPTTRTRKKKDRI